MDLATATPAEIDTELAKLYAAELAAESAIAALIPSIHRYAGDPGRKNRGFTLYDLNDAVAEEKTRELAAGNDYSATSAQCVLNNLDAARFVRDSARDASRPLDEEYIARGGWSRAFLVTSSDGHVHSSMHCSTCNNGQYRTSFHWQPEYSGADEAAIIAAAGYRACTVCYPNAPVDATPASHPTKMFSADEKVAQKAREERAAAKVARDAKRIANALTADGSELIVTDGNGHREAFRTERAATTWLVQSIGYNRYFGYKASFEAERTVIEALAAKHSKTVAEVEAEIAAKVIAWAKRNAA
jgi:hypothetical protein